ncbi:MAG: hypothetical protein HUJ61_01000, partial [Bacilli bacterium]|nr:hypothetical protein [Bacilli bacterium]
FKSVFDEKVKEKYNYKDLLLNDDYYARLKERYQSVEEMSEVEALGEKCLANFEAYGFGDWYEWSLYHWGVKWNASNTILLNDTSVTFDTPWGCPIQLFYALAKMHPEVTIIVEYAEEQGAVFCGKLTFENGTLAEENIYDEGSENARSLYYQLWGEEC